MEQSYFESLMSQAQAKLDVSGKRKYYEGYIRGLNRHYDGEASVPNEEHEEWMSLLDDKSRLLEGQGYRDGFYGQLPIPERWVYCRQKGHGCRTCSLRKGLRDCFNFPI